MFIGVSETIHRGNTLDSNLIRKHIALKRCITINNIEKWNRPSSSIRCIKVDEDGLFHVKACTEASVQPQATNQGGALNIFKEEFNSQHKDDKLQVINMQAKSRDAH